MYSAIYSFHALRVKVFLFGDDRILNITYFCGTLRSSLTGTSKVGTLDFSQMRTELMKGAEARCLALSSAQILLRWISFLPWYDTTVICFYIFSSNAKRKKRRGHHATSQLRIASGTAPPLYARSDAESGGSRSKRSVSISGTPWLFTWPHQWFAATLLHLHSTSRFFQVLRAVKHVVHIVELGVIFRCLRPSFSRCQ